MDLSILIPLYNRLDLTRVCLESLERTVPARLRWEVILVDDGSTDGTREFLAALPARRYRTILNPDPRGYAFNNNTAARAARAPVLCLLNNDTVTMPGWLQPMLRLLRGTAAVGCVGNIQREPLSGLIDHIGVTFNFLGIPVHAGKDEATPPEEPFSRWPAVTAACCLINRVVFEELGGFDERFHNGFEDVDFCLRAAEAGLGHYVANRSMIYHYVSASPGRHLREDENLALYRERWGKRVAAYLERQDRRRMLARRPRRREFSLEDAEAWRQEWERARETRRQLRQDVVDGREDGRRYLRKHALRPWRYNYRRLCDALVKTARPRPAPLLRAPEKFFLDEYAAAGHQPAGVSDAMLFDPPRQ